MSVDFVSTLSAVPPLALDIDAERVSEILAKVDSLGELTVNDALELQCMATALIAYSERCVDFIGSLEIDPIRANLKLEEAVVI